MTASPVQRWPAGSHKEEFGDIIVKSGVDGAVTRLRDIARIELGAASYALRSLLDEKDAVAVSVSDNGIGLEPDQLPRLFEMFSQVAGGKERAQGDLGIGLSLVKRLVQMHGGTIRAESEGLGRGSRFTVCLPLAAEVQSEALLAASASALRVAGCSGCWLLMTTEMPLTAWR